MAAVSVTDNEVALLLAGLHHSIISRRKESTRKRAPLIPVSPQTIIAIADGFTEKKHIVCLSCNDSFTDEDAHDCKHTQTTSKSSSLDEKEDEQKAIQVRCDKCAIAFATPRGLAVHQRTRHGENEHACEKCSYRTSNLSKFQIHCMGHNPEGYRCETPECTFTTHNLKLYYKHIREHNVDTERGFVCRFDSCNYATKVKSNFNRHILKHNPVNKKFKCSKCNFTTHLEAFLRTHENRHIGLKPVKCPDCPMTFVAPSAMSNHRATTHNVALKKRYQCGHCTYQTDRPNRLQDHLRCHDNELRFACQYCQFRTLSQPSLKIHINNFHSEEESLRSKAHSIDSASSYHLGEISSDIDEEVKTPLEVDNVPEGGELLSSYD